MLFNSFQFLVFFPVVTILYFLLPHRFRWMWLLACSCVFYMSFIPYYIAILAFMICIDYIAGRNIEISTGHKRKLLLIMSLVSNIGLLVFFKYFNFLEDALSSFSHLFHGHIYLAHSSILLPLGLSFHTFQAMSYNIEIYRGRQAAEKHFGLFALYVMFYPQLVAGPIERPQNLLKQFREKHVFNYDLVTGGLKLMLWGFFKKVVVADKLGWYVDQVYNNPGQYHGLPVMLATVFFAFQIYCDFSGYTDIAIGAAQVMGFRLMDNFNRPYAANSVSGFWHRWHISLSSWFRDYLYIPLGGNRVAIPRWYFNLFITFLISGLWHGANWTFLAWGGLNGLYIILEYALKPISNRLPAFLKNKAVGTVKTFLLISFSWVFFRASSIHNATLIIRNMFRFPQDGFNWRLMNNYDLTICFASITFMELVHYMQRHDQMRNLFARAPAVPRWCLYFLILVAIWVFGDFGNREFIYFVF